MLLGVPTYLRSSLIDHPFHRREGWHLHSSLHLWEELLAQTRRTSRDHSALSEVYGGHITQRCNQVNEDLQRVFRRVS